MWHELLDRKKELLCQQIARIVITLAEDDIEMAFFTRTSLPAWVEYLKNERSQIAAGDLDNGLLQAINTQPIGINHGDLTTSNILVRDGHVVDGLIKTSRRSWEEALESSPRRALRCFLGVGWMRGKQRRWLVNIVLESSSAIIGLSLTIFSLFLVRLTWTSIALLQYTYLKLGISRSVRFDSSCASSSFSVVSDGSP